MYLLGEQPAHVEARIDQLQNIATRMLQGLAPAATALNVASTPELDSLLADTRLYWIESGLLQVQVNERALFYLQDGDLLGLRPDNQAPQWQYLVDGPLVLIPYERSEFLTHLGACAQRQSLLIEYLTGHSALLSEALTHFKPGEFRSANGFRHVAAGETLIRQGDEADHVFVILEGQAEAFVDGHKVGDVTKGEIFGAMAVFTCEKRNATVVASQASTLMMIPKEQFLSLTQSNPRVAHSLIESMARRIGLLNQQITQLSDPV